MGAAAAAAAAASPTAAPPTFDAAAIEDIKARILAQERALVERTQVASGLSVDDLDALYARLQHKARSFRLHGDVDELCRL